MRRRFDGKTSSLRLEQRTVRFSFASPDEGIDFWERTNPPLIARKTMLPPERYQQLRVEGAGLMRKLNGATDGSLVLDSEYLSVIARKTGRLNQAAGFTAASWFITPPRFLRRNRGARG